ncbi:MAG: response regulator, partial [candidate division Zixibacteria bacterium]|nr:response regulator [candidate division Zixibacteria bacterium]
MVQRTNKTKNDKEPFLKRVSDHGAVKGIEVLLVEDNPGDARLIEKMLRTSSTPEFKIIHEDCLKAARQILCDKHIDVVLLDLHLPDSHGINTFLQISSVAPAIPILALTGHNDHELIQQFLNSGGQDYLVKD